MLVIQVQLTHSFENELRILTSATNPALGNSACLAYGTVLLLRKGADERNIPNHWPLAPLIQTNPVRAYGFGFGSLSFKRL